MNTTPEHRAELRRQLSCVAIGDRQVYGPSMIERLLDDVEELLALVGRIGHSLEVAMERWDYVDERADEEESADHHECAYQLDRAKETT